MGVISLIYISMSAALLITLRETLEVALIVGIVLAYLKKTGSFGHVKFVWRGVLAGVVLSVVLAVVFNLLFGGFEGRAEEIYEGVVMLIAAGLLTWMILWMLKQRASLRANLEKKVEGHLRGDHPWGIFVLVLVATAREGIETVIFLQATLVNSGFDATMLGAVLGMVIAVVASFVLFKGIAKVPLRQFFTVSSVLLILFAAGLVAHGLHEFIEAGVVNFWTVEVWNLNGVLDEKGVLGSLLKALFGYNGNPALLEVVAYVGYLGLAGVNLMYRKK